jgi:hypothetical protein
MLKRNLRFLPFIAPEILCNELLKEMNVISSSELEASPVGAEQVLHGLTPKVAN